MFDRSVEAARSREDAIVATLASCVGSLAAASTPSRRPRALSSTRRDDGPDAVRHGSKSKKRPHTAFSPGDASRRWRMITERTPQSHVVDFLDVAAIREKRRFSSLARLEEVLVHRAHR